MPGTGETLLIALVFVVPGALFEWAFERQVGRWNDAATDRLIRFVASAAIIHVIAFPIAHSVWRGHVMDGQLELGAGLPWILWTFLVGALAVPTLLGGLVGWGTRNAKWWVRWLTGANPAPLAWDHLFLRRKAAWVRLKLKSGPWVAGQFVAEDTHPVLRSYAGGYPNPADLYLLYRAEVDPDTGAWQYDEGGKVVVRKSGLLVLGGSGTPGTLPDDWVGGHGQRPRERQHHPHQPCV